MPSLTIAPADYHQQVLGALIGKSIGVTLAAPVTGSTLPRFIKFYSPVPTQPAASPVLGLPMVTLRAITKAGPGVRREDLSVSYLEHFFLPRDEFAYASLNLRRGLPPPISGSFGNWFGSSTGAIMRSELWALLLPGAPQQAAACAYRDASIDHRDEGIWAAMFFAAITSAAFFITDVRTLLTIGLAMMPRTCRTARAVKSVLVSAYNAESPGAARDRILREVGSPNFTDAPQNSGFVALALFYGGLDFGTGICTAVNCGYDAACVAGMTGTIYGIWLKEDGLPAAWKAPIGDTFIPGPWLKDLEIPGSLSDIANRITGLGPDFLSHFDAATSISDVPISPQFQRAAFMEIEDSPVGTPTVPTLPPADTSTEAIPTPATQPQTADAIDQPALQNAAEPTDAAASRSADMQPIDPAQATEAVATAEVQPASASPMQSDGQQGEDDASTTVDRPTDNAESIPSTATADVVGDVSPAAVSENIASMESAASANVDGELAEPSTTSSDSPAASTTQTAVQSADVSPANSVLTAIRWADNTLVKPLLVESPTSSTLYAGGFVVRLDTGDDESIAPGTTIRCTCTVANQRDKEVRGAISVSVPTGWKAEFADYSTALRLPAFTGMATISFTLAAPEGVDVVSSVNPITVTVTPENAPGVDFRFLIPGATCWWVVGLFANMEGNGFDQNYAPEQRFSLQDTYQDRGYRVIGWEKLASQGPSPNLEPLFKGQPGVMYGQLRLNSPVAAPLRFSACCSGGTKVWLNGITIFRRNDTKPFRPTPCGGPWSMDVQVPQGHSTVQFKWVRSNNPYEFSFTVADRAGTLVTEVTSCSW